MRRDHASPYPIDPTFPTRLLPNQDPGPRPLACPRSRPCWTSGLQGAAHLRRKRLRLTCSSDLGGNAKPTDCSTLSSHHCLASRIISSHLGHLLTKRLSNRAQLLADFNSPTSTHSTSTIRNTATRRQISSAPTVPTTRSTSSSSTLSPHSRRIMSTT